MSAAASSVVPPAQAVREDVDSTRERVLRLVVEDGPVSVVELAAALGLTAAGVRRHVAALEVDGKIAAHRSVLPTAGRGRPARRFVATDRGQASLSSAYSDLAAQALEYLAATVGPEAVSAFAARRAAELTDRHAAAVDAAGHDVAERVGALAEALSQDGYAASARPALRGAAVQLCQGHCPVQDVASRFPQLCEAETRAFSELLGVHVQRLSTLASGGHVCTTHIPTTPLVRAASDRPAGTVEGTR
ncbi:helix-turn-helix transcriptional regulator [Cellulomonas carbonis]|uniref:Transcriptional regulator n=1 Tax=Cellulomonas carbonis T26 TaxID=947969 RepID=A0A0A0BX52_9CELL|nr:winged helix-turn-helix transcriptional regulator [Cellulomonas carbonis]KGM12227.1 transcriptional regulator [Cellulomonas carbonis T26]